MQHANTKKSKIILKLLADVIRAERVKQNKSQRILADEFDIQKSMISRIENGINEPKIISMWTISEALGLKLSELLKLVEDEMPKDFSLIEK